MIRIRQLIKKDELSSWIDNPEIVKVEISHAKTRTLKNKTLYDADVFYRVSKPLHINVILGSCEETIKRNDEQKFLSEADHAFLNGIQTQKALGFLKASMIVKLLAMQEKYSINLSIPVEIRNLVKIKYNETR